jgi:hypothetical protein
MKRSRIKIKFKLNLGISIAPTQPFWVTLGAESRVCYPVNMADRQTMRAHVLPPLPAYSKSERKVNSLQPLGFKPVIFGMLTHLFDHSAKSHTYLSMPDVFSEPITCTPDSMTGIF